MAPRIVAHSSYQDFLAVVQTAGGDTATTNTALGPLCWLWTSGAEFTGMGTDLPDDKFALLYTIWDEDELK